MPLVAQPHMGFPKCRLMCAVIGAVWNRAVFLAGVAAGMKTKTNKVAYLGSKTYPSICMLASAFELGAKWINPDVEVMNQFVGSFTDPEKGYENAKALITNGADVMGMWASDTGLGGIKACKENGVHMVGSAIDQSYLAPDLFITSVPCRTLEKRSIGLGGI